MPGVATWRNGGGNGTKFACLQQDRPGRDPGRAACTCDRVIDLENLRFVNIYSKYIFNERRKR